MTERRVFTEDITDTVFAHGVTLNGGPIVIGKEVTTTCHSLGHPLLCNQFCPFAAKCDGGIVNKRVVEG